MNPEDDFLLGPMGTPAPSGENRFMQSLLGEGDYSDSAFILPFAYTPEGEAMLSFPMAVQGIAQGVNAARRVGQMALEGIPIDPMTGLPTQGVVDDVVEAGLTFTGGSLLAPRPSNSLGMGGKLTKAEKDPMGYSKTEMPYRIEDTPMEIVDDTGLLMPRREIDLQQLQGKLLMPFFTDRSAIGGQVKSIDGVELTSPVYLEGGSGFMRGEAAQKQDALWASKQGIVSKMARKAQRDSDEAGGADVVGVNVVMGVDAIDHSTMPTRIVSRMLPNMDISKKAKASFDEAMKKVDEDFPGVDAPNLEEYLDAASGDLRKQFIRLMDKSDAKKAGFPNIGAVRRAVTDPELYDTPTFSEGVSFGLLDVNKPLIDDVLVPHSTYSGQMKAGAIPNQRGGYMGSLLEGGLSPQGTFFPQSYNILSAQRDKAGNLLTPQNIKYSQERQLPTQMVDQQMLDALMERSLLGR